MKTLQQAAREYATKQCPYYVESDCNASGDNCNNHHCLWYAVSDWTERVNTFLAGAYFTTCWISVEDELPEPFKDVLLKYKRNGSIRHAVCWLAYGDNDNRIWTIAGSGNFINEIEAMAWRPIEYKE